MNKEKFLDIKNKEWFEQQDFKLIESVRSCDEYAEFTININGVKFAMCELGDE